MSDEGAGIIPEIMSETVRATRLGTCYDGVTRELHVRRNAFDLARLNGAKRLLFVTGRGAFEFAANSNSYSEQNSSCWSASGSVSSGLFLCRVAASFRMQRAQAEAKNSSAIRAFASYRYLDYHLAIQAADEQTYFNCLLPDCRAALAAILEANDASQRFRRYTAFRRDYGTGCVTKLYLGAGSIARIAIDAEGHAASSRSKYEGKVTVSSAFVNAEAAGGWAREHRQAGLRGSVKIEAVDYPATSPTREWVHALIDRFASSGMEKLSEKQEWAALPQVEFDPQHPFPQSTPPDREALPPAKEVSFSDELKRQILAEEGFDGGWDAFVATQRDRMADIDASGIVRSVVDQDRGPETRRAVERARLEARQRAGARGEPEALRGSREAVGAGADDWDLGDYQPVDFEVSSWEDLFPSLRAVLRPPATTNIVFARIVTFYYTRLQFGQYLQFLKDVYDVMDSRLCGGAENVYLNNDITVYFDYCDNYLAKFFAEAPGALFDVDFGYWVAEFEAGLLDRGLEFFNRETYRIFFGNYDLFCRAAYGFIVHGVAPDPQHGQSAWTADPSRTLLVAGSADPQGRVLFPKAGPYGGLQGELPKAKRLYPAIISRRRSDGAAVSDIWLVHFSEGETTAPAAGYVHHAGTGAGGDCEFQIGQDASRGAGAGLSLTPDGRARVRVAVRTGGQTAQENSMPLLRCVGFQDVSRGRVVRGATPMFRDFPFAEAKAFPG